MASSRIFERTRALMAAAKSSSSSSSRVSPAAKPSSSSSSRVSPAAADKKSVSTGIMKPIPVSPAMKNFVGSPEISRAQAIKKIWEYVKLHNLQNPANKNEIVCDAKLKTIFDGKDKVGMLEISRLVGPHFLKSN